MEKSTSSGDAETPRSIDVLRGVGEINKAAYRFEEAVADLRTQRKGSSIYADYQGSVEKQRENLREVIIEAAHHRDISHTEAFALFDEYDIERSEVNEKEYQALLRQIRLNDEILLKPFTYGNQRPVIGTIDRSPENEPFLVPYLEFIGKKVRMGIMLSVEDEEEFQSLIITARRPSDGHLQLAGVILGADNVESYLDQNS